jgi:hypothetical protein
VWVILLSFVLLGIKHCNYLSSMSTVYTRHPFVLIVSLTYMLLLPIKWLDEASELVQVSWQ